MGKGPFWEWNVSLCWPCLTAVNLAHSFLKTRWLTMKSLAMKLFLWRRLWLIITCSDLGSITSAKKQNRKTKPKLHCLFISCHFINVVYCSWGLWPRKFVLEGTGWSECLQKPGQLAHMWKRKAPYFLINPAMLMTKISLWHENTLLLN